VSNLIDEIRAAREALRRLESETSEAGYKLRMCKERERDRPEGAGHPPGRAGDRPEPLSPARVRPARGAIRQRHPG